jgi:hypothetical protein
MTKNVRPDKAGFWMKSPAGVKKADFQFHYPKESGSKVSAPIYLPGEVRSPNNGMVLSLLEQNGWGRNYLISGSKNKVGAFQGADVGVRAIWNQIESDRYVGIWIEEGIEYCFSFIIEDD